MDEPEEEPRLIDQATPAQKLILAVLLFVGATVLIIAAVALFAAIFG